MAGEPKWQEKLGRDVGFYIPFTAVNKFDLEAGRNDQGVFLGPLAAFVTQGACSFDAKNKVGIRLFIWTDQRLSNTVVSCVALCTHPALASNHDAGKICHNAAVLSLSCCIACMQTRPIGCVTSGRADTSILVHYTSASPRLQVQMVLLLCRGG